MHSVANETAVSKPNVTTVRLRSLSIVFGTPTIRTPFSASAFAIASEPSPPIATTASMPFAWRAFASSSVRSTSTTVPSGCFTGNLSGFPEFVVPMIVPPRWVMPRTAFASSGMRPPSGYCSGSSTPL